MQQSKRRIKKTKNLSSRLPLPSAKVLPEALSVVLHHLRLHFTQWIDAQETEVLIFSVEQLFYRVDLLYQTALPGLRTATSHQIDQLAGREMLFIHYHIWVQLQEIKRSLEQLQPFCHLTLSAITNIFEVLDSTEVTSSASSYSNTQGSYHNQRPLFLTEEELSALQSHLQGWQQRFTQPATYRPWTKQFAHLVPSLPSLVQIDIAFNLLLETSISLFGDILINARHLAPDDQRSATAILMAMMQKVDMFLLQIDALLKPLQALINLYNFSSR